ncbi:hypothetical protein B0I35DRAFT_483733 [Stachybotrys elegans]|uniref:WSC domain-containing protein n=1 Tax=Stachybotrys elegans TaxID=80388 RepID=A0A8K0WLC0_9HYPO|nr:hypothetical protein B0I35DRAFT_483733 [Stachybotrys elegans]
MKLAAFLLSALVGLANGLGSTDTITWGGDNSRAGYQTNHNMDPAVVSSPSFGRVWRLQLPGNYMGSKEEAFSQPLVYTPSGSSTQYVYYSTTQNNVYKINAQTGEIVAQRNLHIPFLAADLDGCLDVNPHVGIIGTGVIDPETDTIYLSAKTYVNQELREVAQGKPAGRHYIHALDANTLAERPNFPINLEGQIGRNNPDRMFTGGIHNQRPGFLHQGQYIYGAWGSHCVQYNFTGWVFGWDKTTGEIVEHYVTQGEGVRNDVKGGGIWMSGGGLAADDKGSIFFATGNGYASQLATVPVNGYTPPTALDEAIVHMTIGEKGRLDIVDFFMPWDKQAMDGADQDLGTSPIQLLPSAFSCGSINRIGVITGKHKKTYFVNMDNLGGYRNGKGDYGLDAVLGVYVHQNSVYAGAGVYPLEGGYIYIPVIQFPTIVFKFSCEAGVPRFTKVAESPDVNAYILGVSHGTVTTLNDQPGTGLLWISDVQNRNLKVYNAIPNGDKLTMITSFVIPGVLKFSRPVFGDGLVYLGSNQGFLDAYGSTLKNALNCTSPVNFNTVDIKAESAEVSLSCTALVATTITAAKLANGGDFALTTVPTFPLQLAVGAKVTLGAKFHPRRVGLIRDNLVFNYTTAAQGYSTSQNSVLSGTGASSNALLNISPNQVTFETMVASSEPNGLRESTVLSNQGNSPLTISNVQYSTNPSGPFQSWTGPGPLRVSAFNVTGIPTTIAANGQAALSITFDSRTVGSYAAYLKFTSNGGNGTVSITGSAGSSPVAVVEFQTPDGTGWVKYNPDRPFTFGNVTENTSRALRFRISNNGPADSVKLSITVSKPPAGGNGIVRAANSVDLGEGTVIGPGQSSSAVLTCGVPKSQWNVDPYNSTVTWTMNTNDLVMNKQVFQFYCGAVAEQAPPLLPNGQSKYRYVGCFKENNPGRQLSNQYFSLDTTTTPSCIDTCNTRGNIFCGTQYHRECWGGNLIPKERVPDVNCNFYCSGDINQVCGGDGENELHGGTFISLFADTTRWDGNFTRPDDGGNAGGGGGGGGGGGAAPAVVNPGTNGYVHIGCYTEVPGRALPTGATVPSRNVASCIAACKSRSLKFAGVEYGGECWCGNQLAAGSTQAPITQCNIPCNDNTTEICGGGDRLNIYQLDDGSVGVTSTSAAATTTAAGSATGTTTRAPAPTTTGIRQTVGDSTFQGCYAEPANGRAMPLAMEDKTMTLEKCEAACAGKTYWGVEYGQECYCANTLAAGTNKLDDVTQCNMLCPGDQTTFCGAGVKLQLYKRGGSSSSSSTSAAGTSTVIPPSNTVVQPGVTTTTTTTTSATPTYTGPAVRQVVSGAWTFQGCYAEPPNDRAMPLALYDAQMTLEKCAAACVGKTYFGVEYGSECYCDFTMKAGATKLDDVKQCNMLCPGDQTTFCGAGVKMQLYKAGVASSSAPAATSTTKTTTSTTLAATSTTKTTTSVAPAAASTTKTTTTTAPAVASTTKTTTTTSIAAASTSRASSTTLITTRLTTITTSTTKATTSTTTSSSSASQPASTKPVVWQGNSNFTYYSCVQEPSNGRLLPTQVLNDGDTMTAKKCAEKCWNYGWSGVEYGRECWCGNTLNLQGNAGSTPGKNVTDTQCNFLCPGDKLSFCGAGSKMTLYKNKKVQGQVVKAKK